MLLSQDQVDLRDSVREFMSSATSTERTLEVIESGEPLDGALWRRLTGELGLTGLNVAERFGGAGAGMPEALIAVEECGAALSMIPLLQAVWAATALGLVDEEVGASHLRQIADGATYVFAQPLNLDAWESPSLSVGDDGRVRGAIGQFAAGADAVVTLARSSEGVALVITRPEEKSDGVEVTDLRSFDPTRQLRTAVLTDHPAEAISLSGVQLSDLRDQCFLLAGAESIGVMRHSLEAIIDYSKERFAFGRPVGSYQAVKHQLVDRWIALECGQATMMSAMTTAEPDEIAEAAALTRHRVLAMAAQATTDVIRLYGGIGYTWEHEAHLYCKRAIANSVMFGPSHESRGALISRITR